MVTELERDLISMRTKEGMASPAREVICGQAAVDHISSPDPDPQTGAARKWEMPGRAGVRSFAICIGVLVR